MKRKTSLLCLIMGMALMGLTNQTQARTDGGARSHGQETGEAATHSDNQ